MLKKIIYITSNDRSGSTILDIILGQHSLICSAGELHHLHAYVNEDRKLYAPKMELVCSCGKKVIHCDFWKNVEKELNNKLSDFPLRLDRETNLKAKINLSYFIKSNNILKLKNKLISKVYRKHPLLFDNDMSFEFSGYKNIASNYLKIYDAISKASVKPFIVDSSKTPHRFKYIQKLIPNKIFVIHLVRHPVGVISSFHKRGSSIDDAIARWVELENRINSFLLKIPSDAQILIRYEDLCKEPEKMLKMSLKSLGLSFEEQMLFLTLDGKHHLGGSPSKFKYDGTLSFDNRYLLSLQKSEIDYIVHKTKKLVERYQYNLD
jgi:hypothetical protein